MPVSDWIRRVSSACLIKEQEVASFFAVLVLLSCLQAKGVAADPLLTYPLKINGHSIRAEVANTEEGRRTGLMFRKSLAENQGMLFIYEKEGRYAMWMKNTNVPLSVAFIDKNGAILNIEDMEPQTEDSHGSKGAAKFSRDEPRLVQEARHQERRSRCGTGADS